MVSDDPALPPCPFCGHEHAQSVLKCPETDMLLPLEGRLLAGKFRLSRELGKGGMATVFLAVNTLVDRPVAIKLIRPEVIKEPDLVARFRSEAKAAGRIGHPNVCDILDFGTSVVGPYIVMEYLQGKNLGQLLMREGSLSVPRALSILRYALAGLHAAHERGVIHRDLKPENIFLHQPQQGPLIVKLMDFGVAKFTDGTAEIETGQGALLGTPEYMAPEQFQGAELVEPRTDIWAIGAILYRALTGEHAFRGPTVAATLFRTTQEKQRPMREIAPSIPERLEAIVQRCLQKDPADRYPTVMALDHELRDVLEDLDVPDVAPALGIDLDEDDQDRVGPILIGPPSLSEVVDAIAADSLSTPQREVLEAVAEQSDPSLPVRDSAPTLSHAISKRLAQLRDSVDTGSTRPPPPSAAPFDAEDAIVTTEREDDDSPADETTPPQTNTAVPDPIEDATTGIANLDEESKTRTAATAAPVSLFPVGLVMVMLVLFGLGAWKLMSRDEAPTTADAVVPQPPSPGPPPGSAEPPAPDPLPSVEPEDELTDPQDAHEEAQGDEPIDAEEESGSSTGPLVDDPPPDADEEIEILDDETDPSVLEDDDAQVAEEPPPPPDTAPDAAPDATSSRHRKRRPRAKNEEPPPVPAGAAATSGYISPFEPGPRTDQSGARRYCEGLAKSQHLGARGWKLAWPAIAKKFSKVRQMKLGRYWTSARWRGRARVVEVPTARTASKKVSRKFRPLCVARWPQ